MRTLLLAALIALLTTAFAGGGWTITTRSIGSAPQRVRLAELDADGAPDLAFTAGPKGSSQINSVNVWRGLGNGRFDRHWKEQVVSNFGDFGVPLEIADVDENGLNDLILANLNGTGGFKYRLGDGSGEFPVENIGPSFGGYVDDVSVVDYDADGHLDVGATTLDLGPYVDRFKGDGAGGFNSNLPFSSINAIGPMELVSGDVTGDGEIEDIVSSPIGLRLIPVAGAQLTLLSTPVDRAVIADFDGDGLKDIAVTAPFEHEVLLLRSLGGGAFAPAVHIATGRRPSGLVATDLDDDGDIDLAVCNSFGRSLSLFVNDGVGALAPGARLAVGSGPIDVAAADLDADGDPDLVVANGGDPSLSILLNPHF